MGLRHAKAFKKLGLQLKNGEIVTADGVKEGRKKNAWYFFEAATATLINGLHKIFEGPNKKKTSLWSL